MCVVCELSFVEFPEMSTKRLLGRVSREQHLVCGHKTTTYKFMELVFSLLSSLTLIVFRFLLLILSAMQKSKLAIRIWHGFSFFA